jgi:hypothetical protein
VTAASDDDVVDDGRRWWFVGARTWPGTMAYPAASARAALAAYRRDLAEAEVANGRPKRETAEYLRAAQLIVVDGPLSTPQAYERELGWALAWEMCRWTVDVPQAPVMVDACKRRLSNEKIERIRAQVRRSFILR